jgi:phospholipase C
MVLAPQQTLSRAWALKRTFGWYDLVVTTDSDTGFEVQLAGHVENGRPSVTDPLMGGLRLKG